MSYIKFGDFDTVDIESIRSMGVMERASVTSDGLESNQHTEYDHEVKFENIKVDVNITRVKDGSREYNVGVAKGALALGVPVTVPTNDAAATMHAMKKRCDYAPRLQDVAAFKGGHDLLMSKFDSLDTIRTDKDLVTRYLKQCSGGKAERLLAALQQHQLEGDFGKKHVFAKQETLLKAHKSQPRIVYQGSDMYNALTGPIVMELNDRMKKCFSLANPKNIGNRVIYACGASGEELGEIMESSGGEPIESDMKNNDGSQSAEFRKYEAMFYRKLGAPDWFVREFAKNTKVRVWTRYGVAGTVEGQRWSGETTTTTGNSYVSMCLILAAMHDAGITESTNIHGGDDYLGYVKGNVDDVKSSIEKVVSAAGMQAEVVPQVSRHHATFYRKRYVRSPVGVRPVPQFGRVLSKINIRPNRNNDVCDRDYMSGKYLSAAYEHRHVPVIRDLLLSTSAALSDNPYLDVRTSKAKEMGGRQGVSTILAKAVVHPIAEFDDYLSEVYGITFESLVDVYETFSQSAIDYCNGWCPVGKDGKAKNKKGNHKYRAPMIGGDTMMALVSTDL